jgi:hypothetical protein
MKYLLSHHKTTELINDLIIKLISIPDVMGAGLMGKDGSVLSWRSKDCAEPTKYFNQFSKNTSELHNDKMYPKRNGMFAYSIYNYNGNKILFRYIADNLLLMLILDKRAFIGITMLDIEGCLSDIEMLINESKVRFHDYPA